MTKEQELTDAEAEVARLEVATAAKEQEIVAAAEEIARLEAAAAESFASLEAKVRHIAETTPEQFATVALGMALQAMQEVLKSPAASRFEVLAAVNAMVARVGLELHDRYPLDPHTVQFLRVTASVAASWEQTQSVRAWSASVRSLGES